MSKYWIGMKRFFHFGCVGAAATLVHYSVMFSGLQLSGQPVTWSFLGAVCGSIVGYLANYFVTFKSSAPHSLALSKYIAIVGLSIVLNTATLFGLLSFTNMSVLSAQICSTITVFVANYLAHSKITFRV